MPSSTERSGGMAERRVGVKKMKKILFTYVTDAERNQIVHLEIGKTVLD